MSLQISLCFTIIFAQLICSIYCETPRPATHIVGCKHLKKDLQPGDIVVIKGKFAEDEYITEINLQNKFWRKGENEPTNKDCIIPLHNSIRFEENQIIRHSYSSDKGWVAGAEERYGEFPFKKGQKFIYKIIAKDDHFDIEIDGKSFALFKFRMPLSDIKYITICGAADINYIKVENEKNQVTKPLTINTETASVYLENNLEPGNVITIEGHFLNGNSITNIDLENENCKWRNYRLNSDDPACLVAFHNSIRFSGQKIIRNIFQNGGWQSGKEETDGIVPFKNGQNFVFKIIVRKDHFEVEIDGTSFTTFNFRVPLTKVKYVKVYGNAIVNFIKVEKS